MKITTVMDNRRGEQKSLTAEHGLSFLVETEKSRILFDFGAGKAAYDNACKLNIGMENIQDAVGSHGHYDHAGGYPEFVKEGLHCPLYTGTGYFEEKYARDGRKATYLGCGNRDWNTGSVTDIWSWNQDVIWSETLSAPMILSRFRIALYGTAAASG